MTIIIAILFCVAVLIAWAWVELNKRHRKIRKEMDLIYNNAIRKTGGGKSGIKTKIVWNLREHNWN